MCNTSASKAFISFTAFKTLFATLSVQHTMAAASSSEEITVARDARAASRRLSTIFSGNTNVFSKYSGTHEDEEEALKWAALEKLPTYDRLRKGILRNISERGTIKHEEVAIEKLGLHEKQQFMEKILRAIEEDNERFLRKLRERINKVAIKLPKIEVRFEDLNVEADVYVGTRALPTLYNFIINLVEGITSLISPPKKHALKILHNLSGIIKPSRMTLLLGPPSAGKTTLLLALAGKLTSDLRVSGKVTYNGHKMTEFVPQHTSAYISQHDLQLAEMTVRETLDFCGCCQGVGTRYEMLLELARREKAAGIKPDPDIDVFMKATAMEGQETSIVTDYVLRILGLDICADVLVGDQMRRGISGGQKKRLTTGEMLVGPAKALFMDEISTGLDSSTTFQIVKCLRQIVHVMDATVLVSLLQPAPETFELFDDVILLSEGEIVYQGPRDFILDFFNSMGFQCPERKSVADFLQEVTSKKDQAQYWADQSQPYRYISVKEFAEAFRSCYVGRRLQRELSIPFDKIRSHPAALSTQKYGLPAMTMFKACFWREWLLVQRNAFLYIYAAVQVAIVATVAMTVFLRTELHQDTIADANLYMGALFYGLLLIMYNGFNEMALIVIRLPVFYKQRDQLFYPAWAYSIPAVIIRIPLSLLEASVWVCFTYYVIGFSPGLDRFLSQLLLFFCLSQMALAMFRFIGAVGRSMIVAMTFGTSFLMIVFVLGGFVLSKDQIHKWWIWAYWVSPLTYAQNGLAINEFLTDRWKKPYNGSIDAHTVGTAVLKSRGLSTENYWYWISIGALIGFALMFNVLFTLALTYLNPFAKPQAVMSDESFREKQSKEKNKSVRSAVSIGNTGFVGVDITKLRQSNAPDDPEITEEARNRGMILPFQPLSIAFNSISYYVDMPPEIKAQGVVEDRLQLLQDINGAFRPGVLTALMGVSGAGKSTLMDVLAGRKTGGYIEGDISISGYPKRQETFARISGYCEQNDVHSPNVTLLESLVYSAWLRLPVEVDKKTRMMFVMEVMELIELMPIKDALVGLPGVNGLSTEQRKRLTIAVELVANPSIIFMDEPTSGLDARAAAIVMRTVRNTVNTGRTVVCTIHQPSIDIFDAFDELLLLKRGGQVIYAGPLGRHACHLLDYFQAIPGVQPIKPEYNPAAWMLDISSPSAEGQLAIDFVEIYKHSTLYQQNQELIKELSIPLPGAKDLSFATTYSQSFVQQCMACLWKQQWSYWRNPSYNAVRMLYTIAVGLLCGTIFWDMGHKTGTPQDVYNLIGAMYTVVLFLGFSNGSSVQPVVDVERTVYYRERGAGMYSALPYAFAQAAIEIPYVLIQTIIFVLLVYSTINFQWTAFKFFYFLFIAFFSFLYFTYYGMMCVAITPNINFAALVTTAFFSFWNLFSGFIIPRKSIPVWWRWYAWASPVQWTLYGLIGSQLGDIDTPIKDPDITGIQPSVKQYIEKTLGFKHDFLGVVAGVHLILAFFFFLIFAYGIKKLNFQKR